MLKTNMKTKITIYSRMSEELIKEIEEVANNNGLSRWQYASRVLEDFVRKYSDRFLDAHERGLLKSLIDQYNETTTSDVPATSKSVGHGCDIDIYSAMEDLSARWDICIGAFLKLALIDEWYDGAVSDYDYDFVKRVAAKFNLWPKTILTWLVLSGKCYNKIEA